MPRVPLETAAPYAGVVALLDTAVDTAHPDLREADVVVERFVATGSKSAAADHGTACALALVGADQRGPRGQAPRHLLLSAVVVDGDGLATAEATIHALDWAIRSHATTIAVPLGAAIVNAALSRWLDAMPEGHTIFAAAGTLQAGPSLFPARHPRVVSVGALDAMGRRRSPAADRWRPGWSAAPDLAHAAGSSLACALAAAAHAARSPPRRWPALSH